MFVPLGYRLLKKHSLQVRTDEFVHTNASYIKRFVVVQRFAVGLHAESRVSFLYVSEEIHHKLLDMGDGTKIFPAQSAKC